MGADSKIEWTDHSFAPWFGCTSVSTGERGACSGCYAEHMTVTRFHRAEWGPRAERVRSAASTWAQPLAWNRKAARDGTRRFVFCSHLSDVFDNQVDPRWRSDLFDLIEATPNLIWLLLTKRPQNILRMAETLNFCHPLDAGWPRNAAIGCTVVTQEEANRDVPVLLAAKATLKPAFAFVSMEPLMGAVDLQDIRLADGRQLQALRGSIWRGSYWTADCPTLNWVITGGETDQGAHKARPTDPRWERSIRDQCAAAGVLFHRKQAGEFVPAGHPALIVDRARYTEVRHVDGLAMFRVGKKAAGRLLDGVLHDARPTLPAPSSGIQSEAGS